jgi:hypothetical protein
LINDNKILAHLAPGLIRFCKFSLYIQIIGTAMNAVPKHKLNLKQLETKMNKIALSLVALAALSTASFAAGNRNWDLRDSPDNVGAYSAQTVNAFAIEKTGAGISNFDRLNMNSAKNESSSHAG